MREKLTDELMEHIAEKFQKYLADVAKFNDKPIFNFEQFVEREITFRKFKMRRALAKIEEQKKKK